MSFQHLTDTELLAEWRKNCDAMARIVASVHGVVTSGEAMRREALRAELERRGFDD